MAPILWSKSFKLSLRQAIGLSILSAVVLGGIGAMSTWMAMASIAASACKKQTNCSFDSFNQNECQASKAYLNCTNQPIAYLGLTGGMVGSAAGLITLIIAAVIVYKLCAGNFRHFTRAEEIPLDINHSNKY